MLNLESQHPYNSRTRERFEIPYRLAGTLDDVLIVGAGTGNDVAVARRMGARRIDAVEIDGLFPRLGLALHPNHPYEDDGVTVHVTDARAFFKTGKRQYDLVVFGTLDSQTLLSGMSSVRLDNYVYTRESFEEAYRVLKPGGVLAVFHLSMMPHILDRIVGLLAEVGGHWPLAYKFEDHTLFNVLVVQSSRIPSLNVPDDAAKRIQPQELPSDDWPFLYLRSRAIPSHYWEVLLAMLALAALSVPGVMKRNERQFSWPAFFLGAGFLLLETRSVTQMALLFGSTWAVNILVFSSILLLLFLANLHVGRRANAGAVPTWSLPLAALIVLLVVTSALPIGWLSALPTPARWTTGGLLVGVPVGLAGLVFPSVLARAQNAQAVFGANLLGAIAGGTAEYLAMVLGVGALGMLAAVFYLLAMLTLARCDHQIKTKPEPGL